jgi:hypothetical protein
MRGKKREREREREREEHEIPFSHYSDRLSKTLQRIVIQF